MIAALRVLGLDERCAREDWESTHAALVEHYAVATSSSQLDRDHAFSEGDAAQRSAVRAVLERWLGEPIPPDADEISFAADVFLIRDAHGPDTPGAGPQLFALEGETGTLWVLKTWAQREHANLERGVFGTCNSPDTEAAVSGIYRYRGARPAFRAHAPGCEICQRQLGEVIAKYGRDTLSADFLALLR